ncbi:MAG TPA: hypothetical protein VGG02_03790 [Chthoniobacterales bacterium]
MSTAQEIEAAIRMLAKSERDKLFQHLPELFPELAGDSQWERIINDSRPLPKLEEFFRGAAAEGGEETLEPERL